MPNLAERLVELRNKYGYTQSKAAEKIGLGRSTLNNYENGLREPGIDTLGILADFYGVSVDFLLGREDDYTTKLTVGDTLLLQATATATEEEKKQAAKIISAFLGK